MIITTISYRRTKNLGNYESETLEATADIGDLENTDDAFFHLRSWVLNSLGISPPESVNSTDSPEEPF